MSKKELKAKWKQYLTENPNWKRTINNHHYFRTRYSSKFWLKEIEATKQRCIDFIADDIHKHNGIPTNLAEWNALWKRAAAARSLFWYTCAI